MTRMVIGVMFRKKGFLLWEAHRMVPQHHEDCDDLECGGLFVEEPVAFARDLTSRRLQRRVEKIVNEEFETAWQRARSESLGG